MPGTTVEVVQTSLVEWLRARDDEFLAALLRLRADLAIPPPADLTVLATRASIRASVQRACEDLDAVALTVLEAVVLTGAGSGPVTVADVRAMLGPDVDERALRAGLRPLTDRALVWGDDAGLCTVPAAAEVVGPFPGGLGREASGAAASTELPVLLEALTEEERKVLDVLAEGPPVGRSRSAGDGSGPVGSLLSRGLLLRRDADTVELPRQVGLALRGDRPMGRLDVARPDVGVREREPSLVDGTGAGAALEFLRRADLALEWFGAQAPGVLRSGGLGVRDLRRLARAADADEPTAALLAELLFAADLLAETESVAPEWLPTTTADAWSAGPEEARWAVLARAWLDLARLPGLVGRRDDADKPITALSDGPRRPPAARDRRRVLEALADLPPGAAVSSPDDLARMLAWRAPRRGGRLRDEVVRWTVGEATTLGVVALDALTTAGRVLLDPGTGGSSRHPTELASALHAALPEPVEEVLLQADLTAVAPGRLSAALAHELAVLAEVESAGGATVYRFTEQSLRRALDTGRTAEDVKATLHARSRTPVPQTLEYLVDDVARKHGRLRGGAVSCFLRSADDVLVSEVLAHPATEELGLRRIAPNVLVSALPLAEVLDGLRSAGFSPAAEDAGGAVVDLAARGRRSEPRRRGGSRSGGSGTADGPPTRRGEEIVERLRAGDALAGVRRSVAGQASTPSSAGTTATLASLQEAARERRTVWIGYVDARGVAGDRVLAPTSIGGGIVEGRDALDGEVRRIQLHRITSIAPVGDDRADRGVP